MLRPVSFFLTCQILSFNFIFFFTISTLAGVCRIWSPKITEEVRVKEGKEDGRRHFFPMIQCYNVVIFETSVRSVN